MFRALVYGAREQVVRAYGAFAARVRRPFKDFARNDVGIGLGARIEAGQEMCMKEPVKPRPALLRGITAAVEKGEIGGKIADAAVQDGARHFRAGERPRGVPPHREQRFLVAGFQVGEGVALRFPPLDLAREVDVPVVFQPLMHPLRLIVLLQIAVDKGVKGDVRAVVRRIAETIGEGVRSLPFGKGAHALNEGTKEFVDLVAVQVFAVEDMWTVANRIIIDVYNKIAGVSTVLAALMTTVCVVGMKLSNNQQKVDQSVDWLKRIWIAWAIINGIGAFLAYVRPLLSGLNTIS